MIAMPNASRRHPLFVNEYFMRRAKSYMATVIKTALQIEHYWGHVDFAPIVMLFDPSTPDQKSITLANGDIIRPFVHDVKREQMYAGVVVVFYMILFLHG